MHSHGITLSASSAASPAGDTDLMFDPAMYSPNPGMFDYRQFLQPSRAGNLFLPDLALQGGAVFPQYTLPQSAIDCVNMSQVQGFADFQDGIYAADEGHESSGMQSNTGDYIAVHHSNIKSETARSYRYLTDEGLGTSIPDETSHAATSSADEHDNEADAEDAPSPASDTDYRPRGRLTRGSTRGSTRKSVKRPRDSPESTIYHSHVPTKRIRTNKSITTPPSKISLHCATCPESFLSANALAKHNIKEHTKAFVCVFAFAGCSSVFATKNEWKRHVYSQHCNFSTWTCDIGDCNKPSGKKSASSPSSAPLAGSHFNRKDLYTQHLKRMHIPQAAINATKNSPAALAWEERIKHLQSANCHQTRTPPTILTCPVVSCGVVFEGPGTWDERMEHVGKHLESAAQVHAPGSHTNAMVTKGGVRLGCVEQGHDEFLVRWALEQRVVCRDPLVEGGYCFPAEFEKREAEARKFKHSNRARHRVKVENDEEDSDDDAECEDE
jgi:hypothetical protein